MLRQDILISSPRVYSGIIRKQSDEVFRYVGSSHPRGGIRFRIFTNHLSKSYQSKRFQKTSYYAVKEVGAIVSFIRLATYKQRVSPGQILLTEAVCRILFGSSHTLEYREIRPSSPPPVNSADDLNRLDPLRIPGVSNQAGTDVTTYRRLRKPQNCVDSGPTRVVPYIKSYGSTSWRFSCFNKRLTISMEVVSERGLNDGKPSEVNVRWEVTNNTRQHATTAMVQKSNDGRPVGKGEGERGEEEKGGPLYNQSTNHLSSFKSSTSRSLPNHSNHCLTATQRNSRQRPSSKFN